MNLVTVFRVEKISNGYKHLRKVELDTDTGAVNCTTYSRGPRGGMIIGFPEFSFGEWSLIQSNINDIRAGRTIPPDHLNLDSK